MPKCKVCKKEYSREREGQSVCSFQCSLDYIEVCRKRKEDKSRVIAHREKKKLLSEDIQHLKKVAQKIFNEFIRLRDSHIPCISCGTTNNIQYHCGHYQPQGGYGYLRFSELNCNKQCSVCNNHKSGNLAEYRIGLLKKIGLDEVEILELPNQIKKWTPEELLKIIATYKTKVKELKCKH